MKSKHYRWAVYAGVAVCGVLVSMGTVTAQNGPTPLGGVPESDPITAAATSAVEEMLQDDEEDGEESAAARILNITDSSGTPLANIIERMWFSASLRIRPEYQRNLIDFNHHTDDNRDFINNRGRLGVGFELVENDYADVSMFFETQNNSIAGDDTLFGGNVDAADQDGMKVYQAWVEATNIKEGPFGFKLGRQEFVYGSEMLLGDADFGPGLTHDALLVMWEKDNCTLHAWWAREVERDLIDTTDEDANFYGVYGMYDGGDWHGDLYWLFTHDDGRGIEDERHTFGGRLEAELTETLGVSGEVAYQCGDTGVTKNDIRAYAFEVGAQLQMPEAPYHPRITGTWAFASGDKNPADSRSETFNPLFQDNHPRYGYSDLIFLENVHIVGAQCLFEVSEPIDFGVAFYTFSAHRVQDTVAPRFLAPGTVGAGDRHIGEEIDFFINKRVNRFISAQIAYSHIIPGGYIRNQFGNRDYASRFYVHFVAAL